MQVIAHEYSLLWNRPILTFIKPVCLKPGTECLNANWIHKFQIIPFQWSFLPTSFTSILLDQPMLHSSCSLIRNPATLQDKCLGAAASFQGSRELLQFFTILSFL